MSKAERMIQVAEQMLAQLPIYIQPMAKPYLQQLASSDNREEVAEGLVLKVKEVLAFIEGGEADGETGNDCTA